MHVKCPLPRGHDENRETTTARRMSKPQRHFSHSTRPREAVHAAASEPGPAAAAGDCASFDVCEGGMGAGAVVDGARGETKAVNGTAAVVFAAAAGPRSRSPMFGRSRISGVQYCEDVR